MTKVTTVKSLLPPILIALIFLLAACAEGSVPTGDELTQMLAAQDRATEAARSLQRAAAQATSRADATREALVLNSQATRLAQNARATETIFAQNAQATQTARAVEGTRVAENAHATATTQSVMATQTVIAEHYTATAQAQNVQATQTSFAQNVAATATTQAQNAQATQVSASATATSQAQSARATRVSAEATATVIAAHVLVEQEKADWNRKLEAGRAIASFVIGGLVLIGLAVLIGWAAIRFIDAGVLRARVLRDKTSTVFVISEPDKEGRQTVLVPGRSPGAALSITPPDTQPLLIEATAVDEDTTKRDQAVSLMLAANSGRGPGSEELLSELAEGDEIRMVDEPPAQLVSDDVKQLLDGQWKRLEGEHGKSNHS